MSKTNLFRAMKTDIGSFFMLSQITKDLTFNLSQSNRRSVPNKFICLNIPDFGTTTNVGGWNSELPRVLQNYLENQATFFRDNDEFTTSDFESILWKTIKKLCPSFSIDYSNTENALHEISNIITYIGDINILNYSADGDGEFSEIYCHIQPEAKRLKNIPFNKTSDIFKTVPYTNTTICGWENGLPYGEVGIDNIQITDVNGYTKGYSPNQYTGLKIDWEELQNNPGLYTDEINTNIDFNCVIVLYNNIIDNGGLEMSVQDLNVPYGIYTTSSFSGNVITPTQKPVLFDNTMYQFYANGSSYGLRIQTKVLSIPNGTVIPFVQSVVDTEPGYLMYTNTLKQFQISQDYIVKLQDDVLNFHNKLNMIYEGVRENQFNVPTIKLVGDKEYWYVNFKNTGYMSNGKSAYHIWLDQNGFDENPFLPDGTPNPNYQSIEDFLNSLLVKATTDYVTYSTLVELVNTDGLIPGQEYMITDYQTIVNSPLTSDSTIEPLLVRAVSVSALSNVAYFSTKPEWVLYYDINNDNYSWGSPTGKGVIYKMIHTTLNNEYPYDVLNIKNSNGKYMFMNETNKLDSGYFNLLKNVKVSPVFETLQNGKVRQKFNNIVFNLYRPSEVVNSNPSNIELIDRVNIMNCTNTEFICNQMIDCDIRSSHNNTYRFIPSTPTTLYRTENFIQRASIDSGNAHRTLLLGDAGAFMNTGRLVDLFMTDTDFYLIVNYQILSPIQVSIQ